MPNRRLRSSTAVIGVAALVALSLAGANGAAPASTPAQQAACGDEAHRQFDFWIGEWEVATVAGQTAGRNTISSILGGCVLLEQYEGTTGYAGTSHNIYDQSTGRWHQSWVDNGGLLLQLDGGLEDGKMVMSGTRTDAQGELIDKIVWTPHEDRTVQQTWTASRDGGESWTPVFDGIYRRVGG